MEELLELVESIKLDYQKHLTGNKSSATRARVSLLKLGKLTKTLRVEILNRVKSK